MITFLDNVLSRKHSTHKCVYQRIIKSGIPSKTGSNKVHIVSNTLIQAIENTILSTKIASDTLKLTFIIHPNSTVPI